MKTSIAWMSVASAATIVLQFGTSVFLARYLTAAEMGVFALSFGITGIIALFQQLNVPALIIRAPVATSNMVNTAFTVNAVVTLSLSALIALLGFPAGWFFEDPGIANMLYFLAVAPLFGILSLLPGAYLERQRHFKIIALTSLCQAVTWSATTVIFVLNGFSYMSFAYSHLISSAVTSVLLAVMGHRFGRFRLSFAEWRDVLSFGFQSLSISATATICTRLAELVLAKLQSVSQLGYFNRANSINSLILLQVRFVIGRVILSEFSEKLRNNQTVSVRYLDTLSVVTAIFWPIFLGFSILAEPLITIIYGPNWTGAVVAFRLLSIASVGYISVSFAPELFIVTGRVSMQAYVDVWRSLLLLLAFSAGCLVSLEFAAATRIIDGLAICGLYNVIICRTGCVRARDIIFVYWKSAFLTILAVLPISILFILSTNGRPGLIFIFIAVGVGIALWCVGLAVTGHVLWAKITDIGLGLGVRRRPSA